MRIDYIPVGDNPPESLNVIIEVPTGGEPVKYEFDEASGALPRGSTSRGFARMARSYGRSATRNGWWANLCGMRISA